MHCTALHCTIAGHIQDARLSALEQARVKLGGVNQRIRNGFVS
jgi:hypothetical protein